ncbi:MAG: hypothetical protein BECKG1743E_GA0114224_101361, partial [Candidatus Kentron sp. G]
MFFDGNHLIKRSITTWDARKNTRPLGFWMKAVGRLRSCLEICVLEVALRLWSLQGAMGAKIRTVVNYTT